MNYLLVGKQPERSGSAIGAVSPCPPPIDRPLHLPYARTPTTFFHTPNRSHLLVIKRFERIALPEEISALCSTIPERCREPVMRIVQQASRLFLELCHNRNQG